jgi:hypothetical protein
VYLCVCPPSTLSLFTSTTRPDGLCELNLQAWPLPLQRDSRKRKLQEEKMAFGTYAGDLGTTLTYRVKKPGAYGGYKIVTEVRVRAGSAVVESLPAGRRVGDPPCHGVVRVNVNVFFIGPLSVVCGVSARGAGVSGVACCRTFRAQQAGLAHHFTRPTLPSPLPRLTRTRKWTPRAGSNCWTCERSRRRTGSACRYNLNAWRCPCRWCACSRGVSDAHKPD